MNPTESWRHHYFPVNAIKRFLRPGLVLLLFMIAITDTMSQFLKRTLSALDEISIDVSTASAHYKPMFGAGNDSSGIIRSITRYGFLTVDPGGSSNIVEYIDEEQILFILDGRGLLFYNNETIPVARNDFMYIPTGTKYRFSNPREDSLSVIVMGFKITEGAFVKPTATLMIANADEVPFQVLGSHGPTTQFQLLMGTTESTRDRLAAACKVNSLFIMDFAANGTNIPHRHDKEEEIYFILRGKGDIVAGETDDGKELRHPSKEGDGYFFPPNTFIGFYSGNKEGEEHARILAVRVKYSQDDSSGK